MTVVPLYRDGIANGSGLNDPQFQDDIDAVLRNGTLRVSLERLQMGIDDPRLDRSHLRVLNCLTRHLNSELAVCWPDRAEIAKRARIEEKSVHNLLYQLRTWGYVSWERRPTPSQNGRVLLHYTFPIARHPTEQIQEEIEKAIAVIREKLDRPARPSRHARPSGPATARPNGSSNLSMEPEEREGSARDPVVVDDQTITGPGFVLSLPAIDMAAAMVPMEPARARQIALMNAHDWAARNFVPKHPMALLQTFITGDKNRSDVHQARKDAAGGRASAAKPKYLTPSEQAAIGDEVLEWAIRNQGKTLEFPQ
jgi:hypothetical protein